MSTSANVVEYEIKHKDAVVGNYRVHSYVGFKSLETLLEYIPLQEHTIKAYGYDEEDEYWEGRVESLEKFLRRNASYSKEVTNFFKSNS